MKVKDVMTKDVITVRLDTPVTSVARLFREKAISGLPVVDDEGDLVGIVTEVDLIARHARPHFPEYVQFLDSIIYLESTKPFEESMRRIMATTVSELMTAPVHTVDPDMELQDLAAFMVEHRVNPVPVVTDDGQLAGIVSHTDLLEMIEKAQATEA